MNETQCSSSNLLRVDSTLDYEYRNLAIDFKTWISIKNYSGKTIFHIVYGYWFLRFIMTTAFVWIQKMIEIMVDIDTTC